ncbi:glycosyltransferase [Rhodobacter ferrooxidans]|uniref:Glycosyl transferase group 1 n=1 Tax=Rhodobacter ferrooxidans TaxID=371731 RepID=C8RWX8_9RHOB|nr:glycosyltransferase [Rhodobacter sp. SW2]EEW26503.1 glycosyl transferase group 1 [Rhodobacter sp. SW2]
MLLPPAARLLDLTRLVSRLGRGALTGVDRVELAYLQTLLAGPVPLFALVRTALGFVLLDAGGARAVCLRARGEVPLGPVDLLGRLTWRREPLRARAEADLRRLALARCGRLTLARMLRRHLPAGFSYLNVGHANLTPRVMRAIHAVAGARAAVLVHDTIPLDHPEFSRPDIPPVFARKLAVVAGHADLVIHSTKDARRKTEAHLAAFGRVPPGVLAPLGVPTPQPDASLLPHGLNLARPYFVTIGTIEPRKNHALLLDVWEMLHQRLPAAEVPHLFILGSRGWANDAVFARLDAAVAAGQAITELPGLPDGAVAALLAGAQALLFPSLAEGYGLPPLEAMALGVQVICPPLAVFQETMGDYPVYLSARDSYSWMETIEKNVTAGGRDDTLKNQENARCAGPDWPTHFKAVLTIV